MILSANRPRWKIYIGLIDIILVSLLFCSHNAYGEDNKVPVETEPEDIIGGDSGTLAVAEEDDVLILTGANFKDVINSKDLILVDFYAPWPKCVKCKTLLPEYISAAKELKKDGISIAKVDAVGETALAEEYNVKVISNPILKLFKKGEFIENYERTRTAKGIIEYMKKHQDPNFVTPSFVKLLTSANFTDFVTKEKLSLVLFTLPSCERCEKLDVEYEAASGDLLPDNIPLARVNCSIETSLCDEYVVNKDEIPKFWLFRHGEMYQYKGPRVRVGIQRFMQRQSHLPSTLTKTQSETKNRMSKTEPCVLAYFEDEGEFYANYIGAGNRIRDEYTFLHTFTPTVAEMYQLSPNTINILFPKIYVSQYEQRVNSFNQTDASVDEIEAWLKGNILPLVGHRTRSNMAERYSKRPLLVVYYDVDFFDPELSDTKYVRKKILPVADKHRDITFALCQDEVFQSEMKTLGFADSDVDTLAAIFDEKELKYRMEPAARFTTKALEEFVNQFKNGELKPFYKSLPVPTTQNTPLRNIVADSFEENVLNSEDDVLIEFYSPWCRKSKKLHPVFESLGKYYAKERPNLLVARMDIINNDPFYDFPVESYPTIYLLKSDEKDKPILYEGQNRTLEDLKAFVEEHLPKRLTKEEL